MQSRSGTNLYLVLCILKSITTYLSWLQEETQKTKLVLSKGLK